MGKMMKLLAVALFIGSFLVVPVLALLQQSEFTEGMPDDAGKDMVVSICSSCHPIEQAVGAGRTEEEWKTTVNDMVSRGAQIFPDEMEAIVGYLSKHYGPSGNRASAPAEGGQALLAEKCYQCHGAGMWQDLRQDRRSWEATLYRMVGRGALWTEEEISQMAEYLTQTNGP